MYFRIACVSQQCDRWNVFREEYLLYKDADFLKVEDFIFNELRNGDYVDEVNLEGEVTKLWRGADLKSELRKRLATASVK